ncbi:uncharacterized protein E5676_scaffold5393G00130 [Cucumis melo var. makuwa]|uniref:Gag-pol polyprotein n=1 Tax=Cucumis melo var. makuwa TaxID=1194695 RepID=A0A5A7SVJ3_CUCMM|nr:uncharacterized protein E6C27_scaffold1276G00180 [Cucumis melo var. makuwa]TYK15365.1 uncharacterized protein E5676_scaffold5393G00130 [Cucumis melo var. makuwa]
MTEEETIVEFNIRVLDIANQSDALGEKMFDSKLVRKVLRSKDYKRGEKDYSTPKSEKNGKGIRCHECEGFGHIQHEYATYLKRKKKSLVATFLDDENYSESDDEEVGMTLISISTIDEEGVERVHPQEPESQATMINDSLNESTVKRK